MRNATPMTLLGALLTCVLPFAAQAAPPMPDSAQTFVTKAAQAGLAEVELSKLAGMASRNEAVKNFAAKMVTDHQKASMELMAIAKPRSRDHKEAVEWHRGCYGEDFDPEQINELAAKLRIGDIAKRRAAGKAAFAKRQST